MKINLGAFWRHTVGGLLAILRRPTVQAAVLESLAAAQKPGGLTDTDREDLAVKYARIFWPGLVNTPAKEATFREGLQMACALRKVRLQRVTF